MLYWLFGVYLSPLQGTMMRKSKKTALRMRAA